MAHTVLIVDDHDGFRTSARSLLESGGFTVVGEAATGAEAVELARRLRPALVLLDVQLPDRDGFAVAGELAGLDEPPQVILTSTRDAAEYGSLVATAAALGFVGKGDLTAEALRSLLAA